MTIHTNNKLITYCLIALSFLNLQQVTYANPVCDAPITDEGVLRNFPGLQAGKANWLFREHDLIETFGPNRNGYNGLRAIQQELAKLGSSLMIVPLPTRGIVHPEYLDDPDFDHRLAAKNYYLYLNRLRKVGLIAPPLDELTAGDQETALYFARDHHWTPAGAAAIARLVSEEIAKTSILDEVPSLTFNTSIVDQDEAAGSYARAAAELCDLDFAEEAFNVYYTEAELDLFAEVEAPQVVLVGTSNSYGIKHFNFDGFLREALGVDVLNMATSGGGFDESLVQYLQSETFATQVPRLIIWEVPGYYSLNQTDFYEQVLDILEKRS